MILDLDACREFFNILGQQRFDSLVCSGPLFFKLVGPAS